MTTRDQNVGSILIPCTLFDASRPWLLGAAVVCLLPDPTIPNALLRSKRPWRSLAILRQRFCCLSRSRQRADDRTAAIITMSWESWAMICRLVAAMWSHSLYSLPLLTHRRDFLCRWTPESASCNYRSGAIYRCCCFRLVLWRGEARSTQARVFRAH